MKTTTHISRIDIITVIAVIILFAMMMPSNAATGKNSSAGINEIQAASNELALFNNEIEKTVEYSAPVASENFEIMAAESSLDEMFSSIAQDVVYTSPAVEDNFETTTAIENLDSLNSEIEHAVKYTAAPIAE
jgi:hypothetical protein